MPAETEVPVNILSSPESISFPCLLPQGVTRNHKAAPACVAGGGKTVHGTMASVRQVGSGCSVCTGALGTEGLRMIPRSSRKAGVEAGGRSNFTE